MKVAVTTVASIPLTDRVPIAGVPTGPREFAWRATAPATLVWAEALDGGDWKATVPQRDKVMMRKAPFTEAPVEIARTEQRFVGIDWDEHADTAFLFEHDENRPWKHVPIVDVDDPQAKPRVLWDLSSDEKYANPGSLVHRQLADGEWVVRQDGGAVYLAGVGSSPDGDRPFLDRMNPEDAASPSACSAATRMRTTASSASPGRTRTRS